MKIRYGTYASDGLRRDVLHSIAVLEKGTHPQCAPEPVGAESDTRDSNAEWWTIRSCDATYRYRVAFAADPAGGTNFRIEPEQQPGHVPDHALEMRMEFGTPTGSLLQTDPLKPSDNDAVTTERKQ